MINTNFFDCNNREVLLGDIYGNLNTLDKTPCIFIVSETQGEFFLKNTSGHGSRLDLQFSTLQMFLDKFGGVMFLGNSIENPELLDEFKFN